MAESAAISYDDYASWDSTIEAWGKASLSVGKDGATKAIWALLSAGLLRAAANQYSVKFTGKEPVAMPGVRLIPLGHWHHFINPGSDLWTGGYAEFSLPRYGNLEPRTERYFGIRLDPGGLRAGLPPPNPIFVKAALDEGPEGTEAPAPVAVTPKGGRPPKAFWEALWIEMAAQVWAGEIGPESKQADIQRAMENWATDNGEDASPATFKNAARGLLTALKTRMGKNP